MSVDGVWKVELLSPTGWESIGTAFLRNGRYLAGSANHYSIGSYEENGEKLNLDVRTTRHGETRTVFGSKEKHLNIQMEGRIEKADTIVGTATSSGSGNFDLNLRLIRLDGLD